MKDKNSQNNKSGKALLWFSGIVIFLGFAVMSPVPKPMLFLLAAFLSIIAFILGNEVTKIVSLSVFAFSLLFAAGSYPEYKRMMNNFLDVPARKEIRRLKTDVENYFTNNQKYPKKFEDIYKQEYKPPVNTTATYQGGGKVYKIILKQEKTGSIFETTQVEDILKNGESM